MILEGLQKLADEKGGTIIMDDDLLEEVVYLSNTRRLFAANSMKTT